eukprot:Sspe_Gene.84886::Locus_55738_Transcript_2_2_Confidence_0.800_Length_944::g.84886::m.84886
MGVVWEVYEGADAFAGNNAHKMSASDLDECKRVCVERGYGAFVVWKGKAFFRSQDALSCLQHKKPAKSSVLYIAKGSAGTPQPSSPKPPPKARATSSSSSPPKAPPKANASPTPPAPPPPVPDGGAQPFIISCTVCAKPITGEHLLIEMPGRPDEVPVHEECYEISLPTCAWCRIPMSDSYVMYKGAYGIVCLHEKCKDPFVLANAGTADRASVKSLSKPSDARKAGRDGDRVFIEKMSTAEIQRELARRGLRCPPLDHDRLVDYLRAHWDDRLV